MTINEVARLAGVSKATVSRVLNDSEKVKPETKEKILKIIREYNYEPSMLAQGLSRNENSTIGVIIPEIDNEFFGEILAGINEVVDLHNLSMICCDTNNNVEREKKALRVLAQQKVRGVIITPATEKCDSLRKALLDLDVPVVVLDRDVPNSRWDGVYYDNVNSAYAATMALIREGYTKIGVITGDMELQIGRERFEGYRMALEDERLELSKAFVKYGDFSVSTAYEISKKMFCSGEMPQAILTSNNRTTLGFLKAARECDVKVGKEIALIGIDHIGILEDLGFPFSCVSRDSRQMGREAINVLLERLNGTITIGRKVSVMPYKLELRGSEKRTTDFLVSGVENMMYKKVDKVEELLSVIGVGCWNFGGDWESVNDERVEQIVLEAVEMGINVFDIAPVYGFSHSEVILGEILQKYHLRNKVFIAGKCGLRWNTDRKTRNDLSYGSILEEIDQSLMRLRTDHIDLYQLHWPDHSVPMEETVRALEKVQREGKIRYVGLSNFSQPEVKKFETMLEIHGQQSLYNMLERNTGSYHGISLEYKTEDEVLPHVREKGQAFFPYSPLFQGLLTDGLRSFGPLDIRNENPKFSGSVFERYRGAAEQLRTLAKETGHPLNEIAINWLRQKEEVTTVIAGVSSVSQLHRNLKCLDWEIDQELFGRIDAIIEPFRYL